MISYRAACFGKLPLMADFIGHNASGPEVLQLDRWLQEGIVRAQEKLGEEGWRQAYEACGPVRFAFRQQGGKAFTVGVMVPGRDKVGRLFPFMIFTTVDDRPLRKQPALLPLLFAEFLDRAELFATGGWQQIEVGDSQGLKAQVEALSGQVDHKEIARQLDAGFKARPAGDLWASAFGDPTDERRFILLMNTRSLLDTRSKPKFGLQIPGASNENLAFWLTAATELRGVDGFPELITWNLSLGLRMLLVAPAGEHYRTFFLPVEDKESTCAMADEGIESADMLRKAREAFGALGDDPGLDLASLLYKLRRTSLP
jgi:type VI secretion system protein ImpM